MLLATILELLPQTVGADRDCYSQLWTRLIKWTNSTCLGHLAGLRTNIEILNVSLGGSSETRLGSDDVYYFREMFAFNASNACFIFIQERDTHCGSSWKVKWRVRTDHICVGSKSSYKSSRDWLDGHKEIFAKGFRQLKSIHPLYLFWTY